MNRLKRIALAALSFNINLKKNYQLHRKLIIAAHPYVKLFYQRKDYSIIVNDRAIPIRIFYPKDKISNKVILFFHGGGWVTGNIYSYSNICAVMANKTGRTVISVDYRLAPEHPFPAGLEDCYFVTKEIFLNNTLFASKPEEIVLVGDSAGGNLAAVVSLMARDKKEFMPSTQILLYPVTYYDYSENSPYQSIRENGEGYIMTAKRIKDYMELYVEREEDRKHPYVAPLLANDLSNQPKTLIITAQYDPLRDEGEAYGMRLKEFGNTVVIERMQDTLHGFLSLPKHSEHITHCYQIMNDFLNQ